MNTTKPYLLLSNDDGFNAPGIWSLIHTLRGHYRLLVVAPDGARSGFSHAITGAMPMQLRLVESAPDLKIYACSGSPADCIKLALARLAERTPDLVIGGVNHGDNSSVNAHYSGTVGVAEEGAMQGLPAIALSLCDTRLDADFTPLVPYYKPLVDWALTREWKAFTCLNINFPLAKTFKGIRAARMAKAQWVKEIENCPRSQREGTYFWLGGDRKELEPEATDTDYYLLSHGYIAITPIQLDNTAYEVLNDMGTGDIIL